MRSISAGFGAIHFIRLTLRLPGSAFTSGRREQVWTRKLDNVVESKHARPSSAVAPQNDGKPMRQAVFVEPGRLEFREAPDPVLTSAASALVRPLVVGRCDLDVLYLSGRVPLAAGEPIGHEIIGEIVDLGEAAAQQFQVGQRVIVPAQISCGTCRRCRLGLTGRCEAVPFGASYGMGRAGGFGGGLAELVLAPFATGMLVPLPTGVDPVPLIGLADMATDAWRAVGPPLQDRPEADVLVLAGLTPVIGLYSAGLAVVLGARNVDYVDACPERRKVAEAYGARAFETCEALPSGEYEIIVDMSAQPELLSAAIRLCAPEGVITSVATSRRSPQLPLAEMYFKGVTYKTGRPNCRHGHDGALHAWAAKGFKPDLVGPKLFDFNDAPEAWVDPALYVAVALSTEAQDAQS